MLILYKTGRLIWSEFLLVLCEIISTDIVQAITPENMFHNDIVPRDFQLRVNEFGHHWFRLGLVAHWASSHCMNQWLAVNLVNLVIIDSSEGLLTAQREATA